MRMWRHENDTSTSRGLYDLAGRLRSWPDQDIKNPLGVGGTDLHQWVVPTRTFQRGLFGGDGGTTGIDDDFAARSFKNVGAWILGRNMFGPVRGSWPDTDWKGWWGDNPPYHAPVFILTHHARPPIRMEGGTTFTSSRAVFTRRLTGRRRSERNGCAYWRRTQHRSAISSCWPYR